MKNFSERREEIFEQNRGKPHPSKRYVFVRRLVYQNLEFAFRCFHNREQNFYTAANDAIVNSLSYFLNKDHTAVFANNDDWYWGYDQICSLMERYASNGIEALGLISKNTEALFYKFAWLHLKKHITGKVSPNFEQYNTWQLWGSENHHFQLVYALWHSLRLIARHPSYRKQILADNLLPSQFLKQWDNYLAQYFLERGKKCLFVETGFYTVVTLKGIYNIYAFNENTLIKRRAKALLDLYWAEWAQEHINGVRCGPQNRVYQSVARAPSNDALRGDASQILGWFYFGIGQKPTDFATHTISMVTSGYEPPQAVALLALRKRSTPYEVHNRRLGLATDGGNRPRTTYKLRQDNGPLRYIYVAPEFVLGSWYKNNWTWDEWTMIGSQNHWFGATFTTHGSARILFCVNHPKSVYNAFRSVQKKGALVAQQLPYGTHCRIEDSSDETPPSVWVGQLGLQLENPILDDGSDPSSFEYRQRDWIFGTAGQDAFFALLVPDAKTRWSALQTDVPGRYLELEAEGARSPIYLEIGRLSDWGSFAAFQQAVLRNKPVKQSDRWLYQSLQGHLFDLPDSLAQFSKIDGKPMSTKPYSSRYGWMGMDSPFLKSIFNFGKAQLNVDGIKYNIDFR